MRSRIFSFKTLKAASKNQLWIPCLLALGFFMAFPMAELVMFDEWKVDGYTVRQIGLLYENLWKDGLLFTGCFVTIFAAAVNGIHGFLYLYSSRKTDFYHSLPVKRSEMFWQKTWTGIVYTEVPYVVMAFAALCVGAFRGYFSMKILGLAAVMLAVHLLVYLLNYFAVVLAVVLTGKYLTGVMVLGIFFLYAPALGMVIREYRSIFYDTFWRATDYGLLKLLSDYLSPALLGGRFAVNCWQEEGLRLLAAVLCAAGIFGVLSYMLYRNRTSESAGCSIISVKAAKLFKFMVSVPCGLGIGVIFRSLPNTGDHRKIWWGFGLILGTVFSHGVIEVLYQGEFRKFLSKKLELAAVGILVLFCSLWYQLGLGKFDSYIPDRDQLKALNIGTEGIFRGSYAPFIRKISDGEYEVTSGWYNEEQNLIFPEEEMNEEFYGILSDIVSEQDKYSDGISSDSVWMGKFPVKYTLSSGRVIYREYFYNTQDIYNLLRCGYQEGALKERKYSFLCLGDDCLGDTVSWESFDDRTVTIISNQKSKYRELMEALRQDIEEASAEELLEQPIGSLDMDFHIAMKEDVSRLVPPGRKAEASTTICVDVFPAFERTISFIKDMGDGENLDSVSMKSVEISYIGSGYYDGGYYEQQQAEPDVFDRPEQIAALRDALVPYYLERPWLEYEGRVMVNCIMENGAEFSCILRKDRIPDFLEELIQEKAKVSDAPEGSMNEVIE